MWYPASKPAGIPTGLCLTLPSRQVQRVPVPLTPNEKRDNKMKIEFFHECIPPTATAQQRRHNLSGQTYHPASVRRAKALLVAIFERHAPAETIRGPVRIVLMVTWPHTRESARIAAKLKVPAVYKDTTPDADNFEKLAWDAMAKAGYFENDSRIADHRTVKFWGDIPGISVHLEGLTQGEQV